jgi:hypothetical protein
MTWKKHCRLVKPSKRSQPAKQNIFSPLHLEGFTMEVLVTAVLGDVISRSISFFVDRYHRIQSGEVEQSLQNLHHVLLRVQATIEEAERRNITNQAMLWQLDMLRHSMYRGYYVLDAFTCKCHGEDETTAKDEVSDRLFAMYKFNPAKRLCQNAREHGFRRQGAQRPQESSIWP